MSLLLSYVNIERKRSRTYGLEVMGTFPFSHAILLGQEELLCLFSLLAASHIVAALMSVEMSLLTHQICPSIFSYQLLVSWSQKEGVIVFPHINFLVQVCQHCFYSGGPHCNPLGSIPGPLDPKLNPLTMSPRRLQGFSCQSLGWFYVIAHCLGFS